MECGLLRRALGLLRGQALLFQCRFRSGIVFERVGLMPLQLDAPAVELTDPGLRRACASSSTKLLA